MTCTEHTHGVTSERPDPSAHHTAEPTTRLWPLYVAAFTATYTFSVGNISAPGIAAGLGAAAGEVSLVLGAFAAAFAAGLLLAGRLGDGVGRHRVFAWGLLASVATTVLAALAPTIHLLIAARVAQGLAAALVMPQILGTIQTGTTGRRRARGVSLFAAASGVGTAAGQVLGGGLMTLGGEHGWRLALGSGAVLSAVALAGVRGIPATRAEHRSRLDVAGAGIVGASLLALVTGLSVGPGRHWAWWTIALAVGGVAGLGGFWAHQNRAERTDRPVLAPSSVLRLTPVWLGLAMTGVFFAGFGAFMYDVAALTQTGLHEAAAVSGATLLPFALTFAVVSFRLDALLAAWGERTMERAAMGQAIGLVGIAATTWVLAAGGHLGAWSWWVQPWLIVLGAAQAAQFGPLVATVMAEVPAHVAGLTGGLVSTAQQAALGLGVAIIGGVFAAVSAGAGMPTGFVAAGALQLVLAGTFAVLAVRLRRAG